MSNYLDYNNHITFIITLTKMVQCDGMDSRYRVKQVGHLGTIPVRLISPMVQWDGMDSRVSLHHGNMVWDSTVVIPSPNGRPLALLDIPLYGIM